MIQSKITYRAVVWAAKASTFEAKLEHLQRLGVGGITSMRQSTPTVGLEVLFSLMPMDMHIRQLISRAVKHSENSVAPSWDGIDSTVPNGLKIKAM